jgi:hypothetical protein
MQATQVNPELELLKVFLVEVSGPKLKSSQTRVFAWFSTLIFPGYKILLMNRLDVDEIQPSV